MNIHGFDLTKKDVGSNKDLQMQLDDVEDHSLAKVSGLKPDSIK